MRWILVFLCVLAVSLQSVSCVSNQTANKKILRCIRSYAGIQGVKGSLCLENPDVSDNQMIVRSCWDSDSLYFRFEVRDTDLRAFQTEQDHPQLFLDDMIEILIDADNDKGPHWKEDDIVYHVNILGVKKDDRGTTLYTSDATWNGRARYRIELYGNINDTSACDEGYTIELVIPWSEIGRSPTVGTALGVNFANGDNDGCGRQLYDWCNAVPMRSPNVFGTLVLCDTCP
ncbi:carbohydrate-binding family 9-like protein [Alistipes senegalensis]|uniref:carbohydrate-binding family 9-like protein n=1 Tax=Alistipes senegalensis TaxID=1288121 RepID=UPI00243291F2|nr:carbohydrate-binding family 9-like protein [Alistipes senegalensis]